MAMLISSLFTFPEVGGEGENGGKKSIKSFAGHCTLLFFVWGVIKSLITYNHLFASIPNQFAAIL